MEIATFTKTKAGKGFKLVVNGKWYYVSNTKLLDVMNNKALSCVFNTIDKVE
jgi:hypothetical protein